MTYTSLEQTVRNIYDTHVNNIKLQNMKSESEFFTQNNMSVPLLESLEGSSYEEQFANFKRTIKTSDSYKIEQIYTLLREYYLFSAGHDMMLKKKLEADSFVSVPMENLLYPWILNDVKEKYNDVSVMRENPNLKQNLDGIEEIVSTFIDIQYLLYILYYNDFELPFLWEENHKKLIPLVKKLSDLGLTIGDFISALISYKCDIMSDILKEIEDPALRKEYLEKVKALESEKQEDSQPFHADFPITYFATNPGVDIFTVMKDVDFYHNQVAKNEKSMIILPK